MDKEEKELFEFIAVRLNNIEKTLVSIGVSINIFHNEEQQKVWKFKMKELEKLEKKNKI